jgi:hypothetical protein
MQLIVRRTYEELNGTSYYVLTTRLELTEEEQELVSRYKLEEITLIPADRNGVYPPSTITSQAQDSKRLNRTLPELMAIEQALRDACAKLPAMLDYCRSFDVDQIIKLPS